ncbi:MAG: alanine--tRNA ligase [Candidatus Babeliales bacterium]|jgi:alanyl-tRNA synthetase
MDSFQIRQKFLSYFERNGHTVVPSSSLIPAQDPTLLFANAGMNQFKDVFLGKEKRSYTRATSVQKCVRAGGKHNDLDAVGFTERHLTFFEMLGNFSFGDYFKKEAISFAWEFLTVEIGLPSENLYVSVFRDDDDAYNLWHTKIGIPEHRIIRLGEKDNFWQMGDTGPCGPCTEIYVDRGANRGCKQPTCAPGCDCSRFTEIWNLVFMQYDRQPNGELKPLQTTGVDTGMGLERLCMVIHDKDNVYQSDIFMHLIKRIETLTGISYATAAMPVQVACNVIADHVRSSSLLIADGCSPSNDGRGYVLRKIIRRAALFAQKLSPDLALFPQLAEAFIEFFGPVYPELVTSKPLIMTLLAQEVERFNVNLIQGQVILEKYLAENRKSEKKQLSGEQIFKLYDTYGFPPELTRVLAQESGFDLDAQGFETEMKKQQEQSCKKAKFAEQELIITHNVSTKFVGYEALQATSKIIFANCVGDCLWIITEASPFYVESGGQISDAGTVTINGVCYPVVELKKVGNGPKPAIAVKLACAQATPSPLEAVKIGDMAECVVDARVRAAIAKNHTATHLLQAALMKIVGPQIKQAGSLVADSHARFDFTYHQALSAEQLEEVETMVNGYIMEDIATNISQTTLDAARAQGVIAFFGEKYNPDNVRVVQIPGVSAELCGGIHVARTGNIGFFKILSDTALASGTRRITLVTGFAALTLFQQTYTTVKKLGDDFKVKPEETGDAVHKLQEHYQHALAALKQLKKQLHKSQIVTWVQQIQTIGNVPYLYLELDDVASEDLRFIAQELERCTPGFYMLVSKDTATGRWSFVGYLAKSYEHTVSLKSVAQLLKDSCGWRGGGSSVLIQGGGDTPAQSVDVAVTELLRKSV